MKAMKAMKKIFQNPLVRVTLGIVSVTVSLILVAELAGVVPDRAKFELDARKKLCEALAVQLSYSASRGDLKTIQRTLDTVVDRNEELLSAAIMSQANTLEALAGNHDLHWD